MEINSTFTIPSPTAYRYRQSLGKLNKRSLKVYKLSVSSEKSQIEWYKFF